MVIVDKYILRKAYGDEDLLKLLNRIKDYKTIGLVGVRNSSVGAGAQQIVYTVVMEKIELDDVVIPSKDGTIKIHFAPDPASLPPTDGPEPAPVMDSVGE